MRMPPSTYQPGWRRWAPPQGWNRPRCTVSWRPRYRWSCIWYRDRAGRRRIADVHVLERDAAGLVFTVPALSWGADGFVQERGWRRLESLIGGAL
ncbi:hypothetical protein SMICM304S_09224 [Streptomyces microflavus]